MELTIQERGDAIKRAEKALQHLANHPSTTVEQLGHARGQLNNAYNARAKAFVYDSVTTVEEIVLNVYGAVPPTDQD
ncbi:hypothetical protein [Pimelobacter sp. 30-1]|uniref:hypothetical protein n=1 Tax=Pimelobacter sp. 30-1 TaxID=2004991 RepID=UPI001C057625|nr:hypothetical protein [Pimelobacter sp. 30-1]MBU2698794.1 hypothetical protein [Pimelobacter sp. 30-1]